MLRQPDAVLREIEPESVMKHPAALHREYDGCAVPAANRFCRLYIIG